MNGVTPAYRHLSGRNGLITSLLGSPPVPVPVPAVVVMGSEANVVIPRSGGHGALPFAV